jgi:hypothetical protein
LRKVEVQQTCSELLNRQYSSAPSIGINSPALGSLSRHPQPLLELPSLHEIIYRRLIHEV